MQLSEKAKTFWYIFIAFLESKLNEPPSLSFSEVIDSETHAYLNA